MARVWRLALVLTVAFSGHMASQATNTGSVFCSEYTTNVANVPRNLTCLEEYTSNPANESSCAEMEGSIVPDTGVTCCFQAGQVCTSLANTTNEKNSPSSTVPGQYQTANATASTVRAF